MPDKVNIQRNHKEGYDLSRAVDQAIDRCIEEGQIKGYLLKKKGEVKLMLLTEFDEERFVRTIKEEGREEGEGRVNQRLIQEKRYKDLERAAVDRWFQKELYAQYGL